MLDQKLPKWVKVNALFYDKQLNSTVVIDAITEKEITATILNQNLEIISYYPYDTPWANWAYLMDLESPQHGLVPRFLNKGVLSYKNLFITGNKEALNAYQEYGQENEHVDLVPAIQLYGKSYVSVDELNFKVPMYPRKD